MDFDTRYKKLNTAQRQAVDQIDGPVMVIAGPGTGKTELLSMRAANILRRSDTLPESILCLTFTESGAAAMRKRLSEIIGKDAYKIAIHTFHSFGSDIIAKHREFFYQGAEFKPADELTVYGIMTGIFQELPHSHPLASRFGDEFTYLKSTLNTISDIKRAGLTSAQLRQVVDHTAHAVGAIDTILTPIFASGIKKGSTAESLAPAVNQIRAIASPIDVPNFAPLAELIADSLETALDESAAANGTTKPITAWRNRWLRKNNRGEFECKAGAQTSKLAGVCDLYEQYRIHMEAARLYDFDDMIIRVVQAMEKQDELRFDLQETFQYIMVDEFQDTNLAQLRIVQLLADNPVNEGRPNVLVVGDDDQAIYSFQGAEIGNIVGFQDTYPSAIRIPLIENYRSTNQILTPGREVITQANDRLETRFAGLDKTLVPHVTDRASATLLIECESSDDERQYIARHIADRIAEGTTPDSIAVLARKHSELEALLPYLAKQHISVNYERRDNVLELPIIVQLEHVATLIAALATGDLDQANALLPVFLAHPAWNIAPESIWRLSLSAKNSHISWLEAMSAQPEFTHLHTWLIETAAQSLTQPLERIIDTLIGVPPRDHELAPAFTSPLYTFYFSEEKLQLHPDEYLVYLEALRTIRARLRDYQPQEEPRLTSFLAFIQLHRALGSTITSLRPRAEQLSGAIHLMTAHKSKGLEFDHVYLCGAVDTNWGERVASPPRLISYPDNMPLAASNGSLDERIRLFFVAMTRARKHLTISYAKHDDANKDTLPASFLTATSLTPTTITPAHTIEHITEELETAWYQPLTHLNPDHTMQELLAPTLERYRLSATHVGAFLDVTRGGPRMFLLDQLLRFPSHKGPQAAYGTAIHATLQRIHQHLSATERHLPLEDILQSYQHALEQQYLPKNEFEMYLEKGSQALEAFLEHHYGTFTPAQKPELDFASEHVQIGDVRLTGKLDVVDINKSDKTIIVTDYKTGKPAHTWKGSADYEKAKLHRYRQQLLFYKLLVEHSSSFSGYIVDRGILQFVEPDTSGVVPSLEASFTSDDVERFTRLITKIWHHITTLDFPDTSHYPATYAGIVAFERDLLDE